jgi:molecular chaperone DnaK (HSP70)
MCSKKVQTTTEFQKCEADPNPQNAIFSELLAKGTLLPARGSRTYYTLKDNQTSMSIDILEGGDKIAGDNSQLGDFMIELPPGKKGKIGCTVVFMLDRDGRFSAQAAVVVKQGPKGENTGPNGEDVRFKAAFDMQGLYQKSMPRNRIIEYHAELHQRTAEHQRPRETVCAVNLTPEFLCSKLLEDGRCEQAEQECRKAAAALVESYAPPAKMDAKVLAQYSALKSQVCLPCRMLLQRPGTGPRAVLCVQEEEAHACSSGREPSKGPGG